MHRVIYHDALSSWWSVGAQKYMEERGFKHRQIKSLGPTNADNRYKHRLTGDSPEYMPLDNNLFSDFAKALLANVCAIRHLESDRAENFKLARLPMVRTWEHSPTSERIVEDIRRWTDSLQQVIVTIFSTYKCPILNIINNHHVR